MQAHTRTADNLKKHYKRRLSDLSLIDDYLFGLFIQEEGTEEIIRRLLEIMLGIKIGRIEIKNKQHKIANEPNLHGIRLDAYLEDELHTVYNIEVQTTDTGNIIFRMRFYQALIDREQMPSGEYDYNRLKKTIIIFVVNFDMFGKGLYRYTFENVCLEDDSIKFGDGCTKIVLNTTGTNGENVSPELIALLKYFTDSTKETADNSGSDFIKELDKKVSRIKTNVKFGGDYMSLQEKMYTERNAGIQEGMRLGMREGKKEGMREGKKEGKIEGKLETLKNMLNDNVPLETALRYAGLDRQTYEKYLKKGI